MTKEQLASALGLHVVEIDGSGIEQGRTYQEKGTGLTKPLRDRQSGWLWQGAKFPTKISVDIPEGKQPYPNGSYLMSGEMFGSGDFDRLTFNGTRHMTLIPVGEAASALKAVADEEAAAPKLKAAS